MYEGNGNPGDSEDRSAHVNSDEGESIGGVTSSSLPEAATSDVCSSLCCTGGVINQPADSGLLTRAAKVYGSGKNLQRKQFLPTWYQSFKWIHFCSESLKVYCKAAHPAFTTGFSNWKKATETERFKERECSQAH